MATEAQRQHVVAVLDFLHAHAAQLDYPPRDVRQRQDAQDWQLTEQQAHTLLTHGGRLMFDCSELAAWVWKCAGLWRWTQPGWTGSDLALAAFPHYTDGRDALPGAGVVFGNPPGHHMAIVHTADPTHGNPLCGSHGRPGFDLATVSQIAATQPAGLTYLSIAHL